MPGGKDIQKPNNEQIKKDLNFALQKFLQRSRMLEEKQKILGIELDKVWKQVNLKKVYKKIIDNNS